MKRIFAAALLAAALCAPACATAQTQTPAPATQAPAAMRLLLVRVFTTDLDRSEHFYHEVFGLSQTQSYGPHERVLNLPGANAARLVIAHTDQPRGNGSFALSVPDIDAVMRAVAASGGTVTRAPPATAGANGVRIGLFTDPDGTLVEVIQVPPGQ